VLTCTEIKIGKLKRVSGKESGPARVAVEINHHGERHKSHGARRQGARQLADRQHHIT